MKKLGMKSAGNEKSVRKALCAYRRKYKYTIKVYKRVTSAQYYTCVRNLKGGEKWLTRKRRLPTKRTRRVAAVPKSRKAAFRLAALLKTASRRARQAKSPKTQNKDKRVHFD